MPDQERTRDLYEQIAAYPKPPLVPLPALDNLDGIEYLDLSNPIAGRIARAVMRITGFRTFQKELPDTLEDVLRTSHLRGPGLFAPVISATLVLKDDPRDLDPITRAATLIAAAQDLHRDVVAGKLEPDRYRDQVLEMGQYPNLFSTCLTFEGKQARVFKSTNVSRIIVAVARRFYALEVGELGKDVSIEALKEALQELAALAQGDRLRSDEPPPGLLTCATNATQRRAFGKLQAVDVNVRSLEKLRHSFLTLCLDLESAPVTDAEAALVAHSGNPANRWYHSSLQLVVFGNAKTCAICNFTTYLDGNPMMRAASELQKRAVAYPTSTGENGGGKRLSPAARLDWQINKEAVRQARKDLRSIQDYQQATFVIEGIGKAFFADHDLPPLPTFVLALQMTANRLTGKKVNVNQFLTMSKYRCMDLVTAMVTTPEVERFVEFMDGEQKDPAHGLALLNRAALSQAEVCRQARTCLPQEIILNLFVRSLKGLRRLCAMGVTALAAPALRALGAIKHRPIEVIISHPDIYAEVPLVGRPGVCLPYVKYFGLHYQIMDHKIVVTMMPATSWRIPNAELMADLGKSLGQIRELVERSAGSDELHRAR